MSWLDIFCLLAVLIYAVFILRNIGTLFPRPKAKVSIKDHIQVQKITVIIAARNEEKNIAACLQSIARQEFPGELLEVIVVNDHSEDRTLEIATSFLKENFIHWKLIELEKGEAGKKTALTKAIEQSTGTIIVTRDADTVSENKNWLNEISFCFETNDCDLLIMPVLLSGPNSFTVSFQKYENLAIAFLGLGMARNHLPIVCSGANLAYKKDAFLKLDPYKDNLKVPSGDDMFLLKAAWKKKLKIEAIANPVSTPAEKTLKTALGQRLRWASKSAKISIWPVFMSGLTLFAGNIACLVALIGLVIGTSYLPFGLFTLALKLIIDFLLLFLSARMFSTKFNPAWYLPAFVFNLVYMPVLTLVSFFVKPKWKGRKS